MPLFEYRCKQCGHVTTFLEKAGTKGRHVCEQCGSRETEKVLSSFSVGSDGGGSSGSSACPTGTCPFS